MSELCREFGQMLMIGLNVDKINDEIRTLIRDYKIGGVVLYKANYHDIDSMIDFINELKELNAGNTPLFIAIDQENGRVNRLPLDITRIYSAKSQANTGDLAVIDKCNKITGEILRAVGVNMNLAPLLDVDYPDKNNEAIGNRSYGDVQAVIKYGLPMIGVMREYGIIPVVKHFPNHGLVNNDSHYLIGNISDVDLMERDLVIYDKAIECGADVVMTGHLKVSGCGSEPASINKKIIDKYLIKRCNYDGLIMTDDLRMNTIRYIYGMKNVINKGVMAGNNILMIKYKKGDIKRVYNELYKMVDMGKIDAKMIRDSYLKIINIKNKYKLSNDVVNRDIDIDIDKINDEIRKVNEIIEKYN